MLDIGLELESFQPIQLEAVEESQGKLPENIEEAILLYNKAVDDARSRNEDMAIIALKKAISLHPGFYEAMNFLGVCYAAIGKEDMAEFAFSQVIDADDSGIKALDYLNKIKNPAESKDTHEIGSARRRIKSSKASGNPRRPINKNSPTDARMPIEAKLSRDSRQSIDSKASGDSKTTATGGLFAAWLAKGLQKENNNIYALKYIVGIFIGIFMVTLIWYMVPTNKALFTIERIENIVKDPELEQQINALNERIEKLEKDLQERKEENFKLADMLQEYKSWVLRLDQAEGEFEAGNFIEASELLSDMTGRTIPEDLAGRHRDLWDKVRLKAAEKLYQEGNSLYNGNSARDEETYKQALVKFESAIAYIEQDKVSYSPVLYYQAGKAAARCDELERAVELFQTITREFPNSQYSSYAATRLREIADGKTITGA